MKKFIQTNSLIFASCESCQVYHTVSVSSKREHNVDTPSKKDVSASLQKRPFSLYQMRKTPIFLRICQPLLLLLRIQQLLRLHQPSGCCPLQRCNSMYFPVTLKAYENQRISAVFPVFSTLLHLFSILLVSD